MTNPRISISELPDNLVAAWIHVAADSLGRPIDEAIREMNATLGTAHDSARVRKWRRGDEPVPQAIQKFMRDAVLTVALGPKRGGDLASALTPACVPKPQRRPRKAA